MTRRPRSTARRTRRALTTTTAVLGLTALGAGIAVAGVPHKQAGPASDGTAITPVGYRVTPAGTQTPLGDLPLAVRLSPDERSMLVSNDGQGTQSLQLVDVATSTVRQTIPYTSPASLFTGLAWSPDGRTAYASGGGDQKVHRYSVAGGRLTEQAPYTVPTTATAANPFTAGVDVTPDGRRLVVADHLADAASVIDTRTGAVSSVAVGHAPLSVAVATDGRTAYVTNQGGNTVSVVSLSGPQPTVVTTVTVGTHPNHAVLDRTGTRLFVANGDDDTVSILDTRRGVVTGLVDLAPYRGARVGTTPDGLAVSADGTRLYVANAGNNDVAVVDVASTTVLGLVPTGWYPTAVAVTGDRLLVANGKGLGAGPNGGPGKPNPTSPAPTSPTKYIGSMIRGTMSTVALPMSSAQLAQHTTTVRGNNRSDRGQGGAMPGIKHVIYVVRENRTYDQVLGSLGKGNGDPSLNLFGDESATNFRRLSKQYTTFDNFYADAEISAQGWNWTVSATSNPFAEALWPADYSGRNAPYPSESGDPAIAGNRNPASTYIWDRLAARGKSFRNYGFYVDEAADHTFHAADPVLEKNTNHDFRGFDLSCPDAPGTFTALKSTCGTPRISVWQQEFAQYEKSGTLPDVQLVRLPSDHAAGTKPGAPTARAYIADNDLALGTLVDTVSHSEDWASTAIFVTEDDAQNGPDHVDAHRTVAQVISPYTRTAAVDSTFYSTVSMLRSIEDAVGIAPLTQFDAYATPMAAAFGSKADLRPYDAVRPPKAGDERNRADAPMAAVSAAQPLDRADAGNDQLLNEAVWKSIKGPGSPAPLPRHDLIAGSAE